MGKTKTTEQFIADAIAVHGPDKYKYDKVLYQNNQTKVEIECTKHGLFLQRPSDHLKGSGCQKCGKKKMSISFDDFLKRCNEKHNGKYDYSLIINYVNASSKIDIICKIHGKFNVVAGNHMRGTGCVKCSGRYNYTTKEWVELARKKHGDTYDYSKTIYKNSATDVIIICKKHGEFTQNSSSHAHGFNCPKCAHRSIAYTTEEWVEKMSELHNNLYDYSKVNYVNNHTKVCIICKIHGEFMQSPSEHSAKCGCQKCGQRFGNGVQYSTEEWVKLAKSSHGDKFNYENTVYVNNNTKVEIMCNKHKYIFKVIPNNHRTQKFGGCKKCNSCPNCEIFETGSKLCKYCQPKNQNKLYKKTKEYEAVKFLKDNLPNHDFIHNNSAGKDCTDGHLFPDIRFDCIFFQLIIEVDEFKHRGSRYECDEKRMYDLVAKLGQPCVFIRYNPDNKISSLDVLLQKTKYYLDIDIEENDDYIEKLNVDDIKGFKAEYLFY